MPGPQFVVPGPRFVVPGPQFVMPGALFVMPGLDPGIRSSTLPREMPGTSPGMTNGGGRRSQRKHHRSQRP